MFSDLTKSLLPGVFLCALVAMPCTWLGRLFPVVGAPVFGMLLGMVLALIIRDKSRLAKGIAFTSKKVLQYAVILLGFGLNLTQIARVGVQSLPIILSTITVSLLVAYLMNKLLNLPENTATLIGVGSSICGGSAIAAAAPVVGADDDEIAASISVIFLFNLVAALVFPSLGVALGLSDDGFALFAGTAVNDTSSVTAAAAAWDSMHPGADVLNKATVVKLTRTLAIIPICLGLAALRAKKHKQEQKAVGIARIFPMFILWFLVASCVATVCSLAGLSAELFAPLKALSKFMIAMAMTAIGLNTNVVKLVKGGSKPLCLGFACWVCIAITSLAMQWLLGVN